MHKIIIIVFLIIVSSPLHGQDKDSLQQILDDENWSSKQKIHTNIYDKNGNYSSIPIAIIKGKQKGPVFTILSGVHGYEYPPIIATQELIQEIDPDALIGTIIIIPLLNPNSFYSRTPFLNPQDNLNLNRVFPGNNKGTITEKIADYITNVVISNSDVFVDIHGGDANEDLLPFVCYYNNDSKRKQTQKAKKLSESSGFKYIVSYPYTLKDNQPAKYAFKQAVQDGKVALSIECGKLGNLQKDAVLQIKSGIYNMLSELEIYNQTESEENNFVHINKQVYIKSKHKGIFHSNYSSGDKVNKGDEIGQINNEFGDKITAVIATDSGIVLYKIGTPPVNVGETIMCIGYYQ